MLKNYVEVRDWLESFIPLVYGKSELGLARIENLLKNLGNPQKKFRSIHIAGTSGKGSTAFYVSRLLVARSQRPFDKSQGKPETRENKNTGNWKLETGNLKIGLHVSPHLNYIGERMQINGKNISVKRLVRLVNEIKPVVDDIISKQPHLTPSYFEILVAVSFLYFAKEKVDYAVVEVGLGGRLDATNVLSPEVCVITNIGKDHTEILGDTVEKIAREKAGIIKQKPGARGQRPVGIPVVTGARGMALKVIEKAAKNKGAQLINIYTQGIENLQNTDVLRYITKSNDIVSHIPYYVNSECALLAISAVLELKIPLSADVIKNAFSTQFAGRFEEIQQGVILDGAHNPDKIRVLLEFIRKAKGKRPKAKFVLVIASKNGKNWQKMINLLVKNLPVKSVIATQYMAATDTGFGSSVDADEIAEYIDLRFKMIDVRVINNSQEAVFEAMKEISNKQKEKSMVLITGSLYLVGEARTLWELPSFA